MYAIINFLDYKKRNHFSFSKRDGFVVVRQKVTVEVFFKFNLYVEFIKLRKTHCFIRNFTEIK